MDVPGFALVTGAASGIGKACAMAFAREGAAGIALLDLSVSSLEAVRGEIEGSILKRKSSVSVNGNVKQHNGINGSGEPQNRIGNDIAEHPNEESHKPCRIEIYGVDVTDEEQVIHAVNDAAAKFGRLDYVVNAAGIAIKHKGGAAFAETSDWKRVLDINLTGAFFVQKAAAQIMLKQDPILSSIDGRPLQRGSIVNFGSIQAVAGVSLSTAYTASKHAILGLTRSASEDYAKDGLRINAVCPGYTETPMTTKNPDVLKAMEEKVATAVPMQRMGMPSEIADGVLYLAGGRSSFVTGSALMVDGGYTSR